MLAHKAEDEGIITVEGITGGNFHFNLHFNCVVMHYVLAHLILS